jgi:hypothetical protein
MKKWVYWLKVWIIGFAISFVISFAYHSFLLSQNTYTTCGIIGLDKMIPCYTDNIADATIFSPYFYVIALIFVFIGFLYGKIKSKNKIFKLTKKNR